MTVTSIEGANLNKDLGLHKRFLLWMQDKGRQGGKKKVCGMLTSLSEKVIEWKKKGNSLREVNDDIRTNEDKAHFHIY